VLAWEIQELPGAQTMFTTQWDCFVPYTIEDVRTFTASGTDAAVVQRVRLERDRQALYTADLFLYHRQLKRRMVWQFIAVNVRDGNLRLDFPTPFQFLDKEWQQLVTRAFISALQAVQANPNAANGLIVSADFTVSDDVPPLSGGGENRVAPGFAWNELYIHSAKRYLFAAEWARGLRVLDLGCGVGYGAKILARSAAQVVAADVDEHPLRYGEETYPDAKIQRVHIAPVTEAQGLPFADGSFDAVVSVEVIEHVPVEQMQAFFAEMARVLKPSGAVILSTPNKNVYIHYPDPYHVSLMTLEEFSRLLNSQFEDVQVYGQLRSKGLPHTTMEFDIVDEARDDHEIFVAVCRGYRGRQATISLPEPTVWEQPREQGTAPGQRLPVSVIVHTRNEEHNIEQCLECLKDWAGEIIVMDMESTDRTVEIARRYTDKIYNHPLIRDFDAARNASAQYAQYDWVFYVDADERVPKALADALRDLLPRLPQQVSAVQLTYKNYFLGKWIQHAGQWYPGYKAPMLLRRGCFSWKPEAHGGVAVVGEMIRIPAEQTDLAIEHQTVVSLDHYLRKMMHYSASLAEQMLREGAPCSWRTMAAAMGYAMRFYYDDTEGPRDGAHGFLLSACSALSALVDQLRYAESRLQAGTIGEDLLPASAEEFFRFAADVAAGRVQVRQKKISQILGISDGLQTFAPPPSWWQRLWLRLQRQSGGRVRVMGTNADTLFAPSWQAATEGQQVDALLALGDDWKTAVDELREGGSFFIATPHFPADPEAWRAELEQAFQATVHLLDPEATCSWLFAFGWKGQRVEPARRRVLMLTHQNALHMLGGGETQLFETLLALREQKVAADVSLSLRLPEQVYDLIHVFSLYHADKVECLTCTEKPVVVSTIFRDNAALYPVTVGAAVFQQEDALQVERALRAWKEGNLRVQGLDGQSLDEPEEVRRVKQLVVERAQLLLPNCRWELSALRRYFGPGDKPAYVVPNAVRPERFLEATPDAFVQRFGLRDFVLCAARIEPFKNQLMLIWALRDSNIPLVLAGKVSDSEYGALCERWSGKNVHFVGELAPDLLASAYAAARVHAMPSWAETPGLTSMEAALAGCAIVVGNQGAEREYFGEFAYYCNPADIDSVREAVLAAWEDRDVARRKAFREYILKRYTWSETARVTAEAYEQVLRFRQSLLAMPDWNEPQTWQPVVERYLREHQPGDGSLLQLYAGAYNSFHAEVAYRLLEQFIVSIGFDPEHCADIEVIDELPENLLGQIWWTGSRYDSILRTRYQGRTAA
jgi:2-polyprenyl-3-methyl-5-hydroxy-6-metoxy-1,4-benzoquinol methylase/glycosyltransferase involved in cell wall biosynthesis